MSRTHARSIVTAVLRPEPMQTGSRAPTKTSDLKELQSLLNGTSPMSPIAATRVPVAMRLLREGMEPLVVSLHPDRVYVFGRAPEASFVFPSDRVSRHHAQLRFDDGAWIFRDLNSRNGSFVRRAPISSEEDPRLNSLQLQQERAVGGGEIIVLANRSSSIEFLEELPEGFTATLQPRSQSSQATQELERSVRITSMHRLPVFILGPSGSGKTFVARTIHDRSRATGQFVLINCGRLPHDPTQLTSELLGHIKGAFTGATGDRKGKLRVADQGTLFLDEVESLPEAAQAFLLDVLEGSGSYAPLGSSGERREPAPMFRLICASKRPLAQSGLRPDLCQRLAAGELIRLPSLEERQADIPDLVATFLADLRTKQGISSELSEEALKLLQRTSWPGQVRELEATIRTVVTREYALRESEGLVAQKLVIGLEPVRNYLAQRAAGFGFQLPVYKTEILTNPGLPRKRPCDLSDEEILAALELKGGNKTHAAELLGIALNTLKARLKKIGKGN